MKYNITQSRLLYVYSIGDSKHRNLLKVGEVFVDNDIAEQADMRKLNDAVRAVLDKRSYLKGVEYHIEYVECTTYNGIYCYKADDVHKCLNYSGIQSEYLYKSGSDKDKADIWFHCDLTTIQKAIKSIKEGKKTFNGTDNIVPPQKIVFRPEQEDAISRTVKKLSNKSDKNFLWNAKMRFGKTTCGLEVAKRLGFGATLIVTHRPVVDAGWRDDFKKIFGGSLDVYTYATRTEEEAEGDFYDLINKVKHGTKKLIFFVSIQYLRLSELVGGKNTDKLKRDIMQYPWDFVMIDEAHEGTESTMGKRVIEQLKKGETKILSLSGTPFNLLDQYNEDEIYTWDYVMEQKAKRDWDDQHFGDPNPYAVLPRMQILTFTLSKMLHEQLGEGNVFKFHEFFRVWTGNKKIDGCDMPSPDLKDRFVYESAVIDFLDRLCEKSDTSAYPFSTNEFRKNFNHTLWLLPYVKEAAAMEALLKAHKTFKNFKIVNVAGDGNIEDTNGNALNEVREAIKSNKYTITLSCGKLTTGVSVPEWTAVLCMKGSENTPAANYMQTIFRVQTHAILGGKQKSDCYVFDFAPDRALTAVAETSKMQSIAAGGRKKNLKGTQSEEEKQLTSFLKLCPVISMDGAQMGTHFSANQLFEKLKNVYVERAVRSGYADNSLYNPDVLTNLTPEQEKALGDVRDLLGSMPSSWKPEPISVNKQGFAGTEDAEDVQWVYYLSSSNQNPGRPEVSSESHYDNGAPMVKDAEWLIEMPKVSSEEPYLYSSHCEKREGKWEMSYSEPVLWKEFKDYSGNTKTEEQKRKEEEAKEKRARMSVLRGVSIRIPLLVYGAEINDDNGEEITIDNFTDIVDDASWAEYMPNGFSKETFILLKECFDRSIFTGAAKRIRQMVKAADDLDIEDRINQIATIFSYFHNPDKETVLTPWRVVNRHISDTIGGWCFWNEEFDDNYKELNEYGEEVNGVRFVDRGKVTNDVFGDYYTRILEINSKTGLYPLYMAYSVFRCATEAAYRDIGLTPERTSIHSEDSHYNRQAMDDLEIWKDVLQDNIFVVCRTPMAASITKRTLAGFRKDIRMNVKCYNFKISVNDLVSTGVLKKDAEGITKVGNTYQLNNKESLEYDMINILRVAPKLFCNDVVQGKKFWNVYSSFSLKENEEINNMKFTAIVGNPPYQLMGGSGGSNDSPIYQFFFDAAKEISDKYVSFIIPARWFAAGRDALLGSFRTYMLNSAKVKKLTTYTDSRELFTTVEIKGGVCYFLVSKEHDGICDYTLVENGIAEQQDVDLGLFKILIRNPRYAVIVNQVQRIAEEQGLKSVSSLISNDTPFGIPSNPHSSKKNPFKISESMSGDFTLPLYIKNKQREIEYVRRSDIKKNIQDIDRIKVLIPGSAGTGQDSMVLGKPWIADAPSVCTQTFIYAAFDSEVEREHFLVYYKSKFFRALVASVKITQSAANDVYQFVPLLDLSKRWDDTNLFDYFKISDEDKNYVLNTIADWKD